jgi:BlaI family penicillinase repressor
LPSGELRYVTHIRSFASLREEKAVRKVQMVTDRELEILKILWVHGRASVREVQEDLNNSAGPAVAYSTVQTLLNIMEEKKGLVRHVVEGRTFIYIPKKSSDRTIRELTRRFVDRVFDGCLDRVMVALLDSKPPTADEFDRLRAMIDEAQRQASTGAGEEETRPLSAGAGTAH